MKDTQKETLKAITGVESFPFVMAGIAADTAGHVVSEDALIKLVEAAEAGETAQATLADVQTELATAKTELTTAQASLTTVQTELGTAKKDLATAQARITVLEAEDGGGFSGANGNNPDAEGAALKPEFKMEADLLLEQFK